MLIGKLYIQFTRRQVLRFEARAVAVSTALWAGTSNRQMWVMQGSAAFGLGSDAVQNVTQNVAECAAMLLRAGSEAANGNASICCAVCRGEKCERFCEVLRWCVVVRARLEERPSRSWLAQASQHSRREKLAVGSLSAGDGSRLQLRQLQL
jgi:hypothetical protein